jgi:hypothetical protein
MIMDMMELEKLQALYDEANRDCEHRRNHPNGCDDCDAVWCSACFRWHKEPINMDCQFSYMLNKNASALMELARTAYQYQYCSNRDCQFNSVIASVPCISCRFKATKDSIEAEKKAAVDAYIRDWHKPMRDRSNEAIKILEDKVIKLRAELEEKNSEFIWLVPRNVRGRGGSL